MQSLYAFRKIATFVKERRQIFLITGVIINSRLCVMPFFIV